MPATPPSLPATAVVDVKPAALSKINWVQAIAFGAMVASYFGIQVPPDVQAALQAAIVAITTVVTWILRTWFTTSVTSSSVPGVTK